MDFERESEVSNSIWRVRGQVEDIRGEIWSDLVVKDLRYAGNSIITTERCSAESYFCAGNWSAQKGWSGRSKVVGGSWFLGGFE